MDEFNGQHMMMLGLIAIIPALAALVIPSIYYLVFSKEEEIEI